MDSLKQQALQLARRTVKGAVALALHYSKAQDALAALQRRAVGGRRVLILSYHRVVKDFAAEKANGLFTLNISQHTFRRHLEVLRETHDIVPLDAALDVLEGRAAAKRDLAVITFDDGYRDVYEYAFPVMREMRVPAVVYVPSAFIGTTRRLGHDRLWMALTRMVDRRIGPMALGVGGEFERCLAEAFEGGVSAHKALERLIERNPTPRLLSLCDALEDRLGLTRLKVPEGQLPMSWEQLREMDRYGIETGGHTADHTVLTNQPLADARREIAECKTVIERGLGKAIHHFAYCNGYYSAGVAQALKAEGFRSAVTTEDMANVPGVDPFALKRKVLWQNSSVGLLGTYSRALTACQLNDTFNLLGIQKAVPGAKPTRFDPAPKDETRMPDSLTG